MMRTRDHLKIDDLMPPIISRANRSGCRDPPIGFHRSPDQFSRRVLCHLILR